MREREERLTVPHELSGRQIKNKPTNGTKINIKKRKSCHLQHNKTIAAPQLLFVAKLSFVYHRRIKLNQTVDKRKDRLIATKQQTSQISTGKQIHQRKNNVSAPVGAERERNIYVPNLRFRAHYLTRVCVPHNRVSDSTDDSLPDIKFILLN
jgi:hypothetical protein